MGGARPASAGCGICLAMRLIQMLAAIGSTASRRDLAAPFLGSFALNNVLPLRLGDMARAAAFRQKIGVSVSGGLASLLVERVYDLYALLLVGLIALVSLSQGTLAWDPAIMNSAVFSLGIVVGLLSVVLLLPRRFAMLACWLRGTPLGKIIPCIFWRFGIRTLIQISQIVRRAGTFSLMALSVVAWVLEGLVVFFSAKALMLAAQVGGSWLALVAANLGTLIPGTPGHFGTYHFIGARTLSLSGPDFSEALPVITLAHFIIWAGITAAGFLALALQGGRGAIPASRAAHDSKIHP